MVCEYHTYQTTALVQGMWLSGLGVAYNLVSCGLGSVSKEAGCSCLSTSGAANQLFGHGTYSQATLGLLSTCVTGCDEFASNQLQWRIKGGCLGSMKPHFVKLSFSLV